MPGMGAMKNHRQDFHSVVFRPPATNTGSHAPSPGVRSPHAKGLLANDCHTVGSEVGWLLYKALYTPAQLKGNSGVMAFPQICPNFMILPASDPICQGVTANPTSIAEDTAWVSFTEPHKWTFKPVVHPGPPRLPCSGWARVLHCLKPPDHPSTQPGRLSGPQVRETVTRAGVC